MSMRLPDGVIWVWVPSLAGMIDWATTTDAGNSPIEISDTSLKSRKPIGCRQVFGGVISFIFFGVESRNGNSGKSLEVLSKSFPVSIYNAPDRDSKIQQQNPRVNHLDRHEGQPLH
jgi:hypothetical protein